MQMSFVSYLCVVVVENKESDERHYMLPIKVTLAFSKLTLVTQRNIKYCFEMQPVNPFVWSIRACLSCRTGSKKCILYFSAFSITNLITKQ